MARGAVKVWMAMIVKPAADAPVQRNARHGLNAAQRNADGDAQCCGYLRPQVLIAPPEISLTLCAIGEQRRFRNRSGKRNAKRERHKSTSNSTSAANQRRVRDVARRELLYHHAADRK